MKPKDWRLLASLLLTALTAAVCVWGDPRQKLLWGQYFESARKEMDGNISLWENLE
jgi:hypothetical protein